MTNSLAWRTSLIGDDPRAVAEPRDQRTGAFEGDFTQDRLVRTAFEWNHDRSGVTVTWPAVSTKSRIPILRFRLVEARRLLASRDTAVADHHDDAIEINLQTNRAGQQSRWKKSTLMPRRASLL